MIWSTRAIKVTGVLLLACQLYGAGALASSHKKPATTAGDTQAHAKEGGSTESLWADFKEDQAKSKRDKDDQSNNVSNNVSKHETLQCTITKTDDGLGAQINQMTDEAIKNSDFAQETDKLVQKFRTAKHKAAVAAAEALYTFAPYRGFGPSKEGSNIVLEQVPKIKSLAGAEYIKQRIEDRIHTQVVEATLEIAMGLDSTDPDQRQQMIDTGYSKLKDLLGDEQAKAALGKLTSWSKDLDVSASAYAGPPWDVTTFENKVRQCMTVSIQTDPMLHDIVKRVRKYHRSKAAVVASGVIESALEVGSVVAPGVIGGVAAQAAHSVFIAGTGGSESTKLVNSLYYCKSIESRWKRLNQETEMALRNREMAMRLKSPTLMACSEAVLAGLIGADRIPEVLGDSVLANGTVKPQLPIQTAEKPLDPRSEK